MASGVTFYTGSRWSGRSQGAIIYWVLIGCAAQLEAVRCYGVGIEATGRC